jgi:hypothetical protein
VPEIIVDVVVATLVDSGQWTHTIWSLRVTSHLCCHEQETEKTSRTPVGFAYGTPDCYLSVWGIDTTVSMAMDLEGSEKGG